MKNNRSFTQASVVSHNNTITNDVFIPGALIELSQHHEIACWTDIPFRGTVIQDVLSK
jgi:hypothetical protein